MKRGGDGDIRLRSIVKLIRFHEYGPTFMLATLFSALIASENAVDHALIPLLLFVGLSSSFGYVVNHISDKTLDRDCDNPITESDALGRTALALSLLLFLVSVLLLSLLPLYHVAAGAGILFLAITYSYIIRAKSKPVIDLVYHALGPGIFVLMAYGLYSPLDTQGLHIFAIAFLASALAEVVQEIRDFEVDRKMLRTTVVVIGSERALKLAIVLLLGILFAYLSTMLTGTLPLSFIALSPLIYFLLEPVVRSIINPQLRKSLVYTLHKRGVMIALILLGFYLFISLY